MYINRYLVSAICVVILSSLEKNIPSSPQLLISLQLGRNVDPASSDRPALQWLGRNKDGLPSQPRDGGVLLPERVRHQVPGGGVPGEEAVLTFMILF